MHDLGDRAAPMTPTRNRSICNSSLVRGNNNRQVERMPRQVDPFESFATLSLTRFADPTRRYLPSGDGGRFLELKYRSDFADETAVVVTEIGRVAFQDRVPGCGIEDSELLQRGDRDGGVGAESAIEHADGHAQTLFRHGHADESLGSTLCDDATTAERHQVGDELAMARHILRMSNHCRT